MESTAAVRSRAMARCALGVNRIDWLRTLVAKGPRRLQREHLHHSPVNLSPPRLHLIVLDTSGSMRRGGRLARAKGHAALLIEQAAKAGDWVALLAFGGQGVQLLVPPGPARRSGSLQVRPLGGGGGTPLTEALRRAEEVLKRHALRQGGVEHWLWLLTDGRSLETPLAPPTATHRVILDFDDAEQPLGQCARWAAQWGAIHHLAMAVPR